MCGIAGITGPEVYNKKVLLGSMQKILAHRGPDDHGSYFSENVALGHRRLSILDLSPRGRNPMVSFDGRYIITYNGEVFNYRELREEIADRYPFKTSTDTEVVLAAFMLWGKSCVKNFIGMFAFAIWDTNERVLFCARDRFGIKPFYYMEYRKHFYFSSEIKALLLTNCRREADMSAVYQYLKWGFYDHDAKTFFKGINRLSPGHMLIWKDGQISLSPYWELKDEVDESVETGQDNSMLADRIYSALQDSVRLALRSDVPVGVNLSGGLDSSVLITLLDQTLGQENRLEGFTQDYRDKRFSERPWVEEIAQRTGRNAHLSYMSDLDFIESDRSMLWHQDEPYGGAPVTGYVGMYQTAHNNNVKVLLDGNGLDEALCGYRQYNNVLLRTLAQEKDPELESYIEAYAREWNVSMDAVRSIIAKEQSNNLLSRDGTQAVEESWLSDKFEQDCKQEYPLFEKPFKSELKNAMYQDLRYTKIPRALRFNDRVSMAFSKELRVPFLDHRIFKLSFSIPDKRLFANYRPKGILRNRLEDIVPDKVRYAPKRHIQTPQSEWFSTTLREYTGDLFHSKSFKQRGIINSEKAIRIFSDLNGKPLENSFFLWQAVNLENWFRMFIDSSSLSVKAEAFPTFEHETLKFSSSMH